MAAKNERPSIPGPADTLLNPTAPALPSCSCRPCKPGGLRVGQTEKVVRFSIMSTTYTVRLRERVEVAEGTMAFHFEKPAEFQFKPGQNADFTLIDPPETDEEGNKRTFSLAGTPAENELMVATRMRDTAFKRVLKTMPVGTELKMAGPYGSFTLHQNAARPAVFLAGGIGITPFRSIILETQRNRSDRRLFLFYANRRPEDAAFLEELQALTQRNERFTLVATMTAMDTSKRPWSGRKGRVNREMLVAFVEDLAAPIYYIAGPPGMVGATREMLVAAGISEDSIRAEDFPGY
jgi:ferredoxin-NADP reductase